MATLRKVFASQNFELIRFPIVYISFDITAELSEENISVFFLFFNWDSLHARLNNHYKAWSYKKKKKIKAYRKSV